MQDYLDMLFEVSEDRGKAAMVMAAILWVLPELGRPLRTALPLAAAALEGWTRLEPGFTRPPLPYAVAMATVVSMALGGIPEQALMVWVLSET